MTNRPLTPPDTAPFKTPVRRRVMLAAPLGLATTLLRAPSIVASLALSACASGSAPAMRPSPLPAGLREGEQRAWSMPETPPASSPETDPYRRMQLAIPAGYAAATQPWPLLVFLHGAGERGFDIEDVKRCGPPMLAARGQAYPMIVCSPQVDPDMRWQPARLHALVAALGTHFNIDRRRVLATGLSLGGSGAWRWACAFPDDLAAIAPICGWVEPAAVVAMRRVPVRAYHGDQDPLVPLERQQACVAELQRLGGTASLTVYRGVGHDAWTPAYEDPGLLPWLMAQTLG